MQSWSYFDTGCKIQCTNLYESQSAGLEQVLHLVLASLCIASYCCLFAGTVHYVLGLAGSQKLPIVCQCVLALLWLHCLEREAEFHIAADTLTQSGSHCLAAIHSTANQRRLLRKGSALYEGQACITTVLRQGNVRLA